MVTFQISNIKVNAISLRVYDLKFPKNSMLGSLLAPCTHSVESLDSLYHSQRAVKNGKSGIHSSGIHSNQVYIQEQSGNITLIE